MSYNHVAVISVKRVEKDLASVLCISSELFYGAEALDSSATSTPSPLDQINYINVSPSHSLPLGSVWKWMDRLG